MITITMKRNCGNHRFGSDRTPPRGVANEPLILSVPIHDRQADLETKRRAVKLARETSKINLALAKQARDNAVQTKAAEVKAIKVTLKQAKVNTRVVKSVQNTKHTPLKIILDNLQINEITVKTDAVIISDTPLINIYAEAVSVDEIKADEMVETQSTETEVKIDLSVAAEKSEVEAVTIYYSDKRAERIESMKLEQAERVARIRARANAIIDRSEHMRIQELERITHIRQCANHNNDNTVISPETLKVPKVIITPVETTTTDAQPKQLTSLSQAITLTPPQFHIILPTQVKSNTTNHTIIPVILASKRKVRAKLKLVWLSWKRVRLKHLQSYR